jgi:protein involved in ribonucleotide reduction
MCVGRIAEGVSIVSESEVLVVFVTVEGEDPAMEVFRRVQDCIKSERWEQKMIEVVKSPNKHIFKKFAENYKLSFFIFQIIHLLFTSSSEDYLISKFKI